jgi:hypothetical protein
LLSLQIESFKGTMLDAIYLRDIGHFTCAHQKQLSIKSKIMQKGAHGVRVLEERKHNLA